MEWSSLVLDLGAILAIAVFCVGGYFVSRAASGWLIRRGAPPHAVRLTRIVVVVVAVALAAAVVFIAYGPLPAASGLTVSAIVGLALTMGLQTIIGNVIAGFILLNDRLLRLGDSITIGGTSGTVVQLGLVTTWLRLADGSVASVSNSNLLSGALVNHSAGNRLKGEY
jgi:potassium-dependent mechanosensitive channel